MALRKSHQNSPQISRHPHQIKRVTPHLLQGGCSDDLFGSSGTRKWATYGIGGYGFQTPNSVSFLFRLSPSFGEKAQQPTLCVRKPNSASSSQNSPSLPHKSVSSLLQTCTLETVFRPEPTFSRFPAKVCPQNAKNCLHHVTSLSLQNTVKV